VRSLLVVDLHGLLDHSAGLCEVGRALQQEFHLQDPVDALGQRVLIAVIAIGHRARDAVTPVDLLIVVGAVLDPTIGVMHQRLLRLPALERHFQRPTDLLGVQAVVDVVAHDLA
jgi:hypothetical protein